MPEVLSGEEVAAPNDLAYQNGKPDFDLVKPGRVFGGKVKNDGMRVLAQESFPGSISPFQIWSPWGK